MKEERFEKVVEWEDEEKRALMGLFIFIMIVNLIFVTALYCADLEDRDVHFILVAGFSVMWILLASGIIFSHKKIYWRKVK